MDTITNIPAKQTIHEILLDKFVLKDKENMSEYAHILMNPFIDTDYIIACDTFYAILIPRKELDHKEKYSFSTIFTKNIWKGTNNISGGFLPATISVQGMRSDFAKLPRTYLINDEHTVRIKIGYQVFDPFIIDMYLLSVAKLLQVDTIELIYQRPTVSYRHPCSIFKIGNVHVCIAPTRKDKKDRVHFRYVQSIHKPL